MTHNARNVQRNKSADKWLVIKSVCYLATLFVYSVQTGLTGPTTGHSLHTCVQQLCASNITTRVRLIHCIHSRLFAKLKYYTEFPQTEIIRWTSWNSSYFHVWIISNRAFLLPNSQKTYSKFTSTGHQPIRLGFKEDVQIYMFKIIHILYFNIKNNPQVMALSHHKMDILPKTFDFKLQFHFPSRPIGVSALPAETKNIENLKH